MPCRPIKERVVYHEENLDTDLPIATTVPDLADHPFGKISLTLFVKHSVYNI